MRPGANLKSITAWPTMIGVGNLPRRQPAQSRVEHPDGADAALAKVPSSRLTVTAIPSVPVHAQRRRANGGHRNQSWFDGSPAATRPCSSIDGDLSTTACVASTVMSRRGRCAGFTI